MLKKICFISLFPEVIQSICHSSILKRAQSDKRLELFFIQLRDFSEDKHRSVDAPPAGGGEGMLLRVDVLYNAWMHAKKMISEETPNYRIKTIYLSPQGKVLTQTLARKMGEEKEESLILVCGHYEGLDERFIELCVDEELSIGDFVLTGGELPACVLVDALVRWIPGVLGNGDSALKDSLSPDLPSSQTSSTDSLSEPLISRPLLKYPQYTKPTTFMGKEIPPVLLSGHHGKIEKWRAEKRIEVTQRKRPDLLK